MVWNDLINRLRAAGLHPVEEIYIDNYGNALPLDNPKFRGRFLRCARGVLQAKNLKIETLLFPSEEDLQEFLALIGDDPWWVPHENVVFHFPEADPEIIGNILEAVAGR